jgi:hypothetical protein
MFFSNNTLNVNHDIGIMPPRNHSGFRAGEMGSAVPIPPIIGKISTITTQRAYNPNLMIRNIKTFPRG